jgi:hypothetical protein
MVLLYVRESQEARRTKAELNDKTKIELSRNVAGLWRTKSNKALQLTAR